jgi:hypothetical protein
MKSPRLAAILPALFLALVPLGSGCSSSSPSPTPTPTPTPSGCTADNATTQLKITNAASFAVPVMVTLGQGPHGSPPAYGITNVSQLPPSWQTYAQTNDGNTGTIFLLDAGQSTCFNSGTLSFAGNVGFGPLFGPRGCGTTDRTQCYPNGSELFEFALNFGGTQVEAIDLSGVNGTNALLTVNLSTNDWNNNVQLNVPVTSFANQSIVSWQAGVSGVYGWGADWCNARNDPPNPKPGCPVPLDAPATAQLQTSSICNVQRAGGVTGGTIEVVFNGWATGSGPGTSCVGAFVAPNPTTGTWRGGTPVTLTGFGFDNVSGILIQNPPATIVSKTDGTLVFTTPLFQNCSGSSPQNVGIFYQLASGGAPINLPDPASTFTYTCN